MATLCTLLTLALPCGAQARAGARARTQPQPRVPARAAIPVSVSVDASEPGPTVPRDFLGLSFEVGALRRIAGYSSEETW